MHLISGDAPAPVAALAKTLGLENWTANALPEDKAAFVAELKDQGAHVLMVGDGLNDTAALSITVTDANDAPTVTLTNTVAESIVEAEHLPIRMTAHTQCFRSEAGSAGKDTSGILRQHQFEKVEMVSITAPEQSEAEHARMTRCAEDILERLGLAYRTIVLCTGDMGFGARRTHDIEVWLPGQNMFREISSVSTCGDFQARRMNARTRGEDGKPTYVHTLNGSGLAVGRTLIAVLENGQTEDGGVVLPQVLGPWLGGKTRLTPDGELI
jgi:seryl-tRNA synthetase